MKTASKKIVETVAALLNRHVQQSTPAGKVLAADDGTVRTLINELLKELAEGGELVSAVETSGLLLGFVPRYQVEIPVMPPAPVDPPPPGPDNPVK